MEVGIGASMAGGRALVCMKHVGLNVAADPFFSAAYIGVEAGMVVVSADDPGMHSSQDEQDNRNYAKFARVPLLEPSDSGEAKDFMVAAYELSERFDTPVLFRTTTRTSHSKSLVTFGERVETGPGGQTQAQLQQVRHDARRTPRPGILSSSSGCSTWPSTPKTARSTASRWAIPRSGSSPPGRPTATPAKPCPAPATSSWA